MTQIYIDKDEWYPVRVPRAVNDHTYRPPQFPIIQVPDDLLPRWENLMTKFDAFQKELITLSKTP